MPQYSWPSLLPATPLRNSYTHTLAGNSLTFEMDTGPSRSWRVTSSNPSYRELSYVLKEEFPDPTSGEIINQKNLFMAFWEIVDSNIWFWLPDPEDKSRELYVRIVPSQEKKGPELTLLSLKVWKAGFQVEVAALVSRKRNQ